MKRWGKTYDYSDYGADYGALRKQLAKLSDFWMTGGGFAQFFLAWEEIFSLAVCRS